MMPRGRDEEALLAAFGARIRVLREARGWSQERLALKAGLHRTYLSAAERGERNVSLINVVAIARALGCQVGDLVD